MTPEEMLMQLIKYRLSLIRQLNDLFEIYGNLPIQAVITKLQCKNMEDEKQLHEITEIQNDE